MMDESNRTDAEVEVLQVDQNGRIQGSWLCCIPCYWLKRNTSFQKTLLTVATLLVTALLVASPVIFLISSVPGDRGRDCHEQETNCRNDAIRVCEEEHCQAAALSIKSSILWEEDPCRDFYQFACGRHSKNADDNLDSLHWHSSFVSLQGVITQNIQLFAVLNELGGYVPSNSTVPQDLTSLIFRLFLINGAPLFHLKLDQDVNNSTRLAPYIDLPRDFIFEDRVSRFIVNTESERASKYSKSGGSGNSKEFAFLKAAVEERRLLQMERILQEFLPENMTSDFKAKEIQQTLLFTSMLAKLYPPQKRRPKLEEIRNNSMTVMQLTKNYPYIRWQYLFEQAFNSEFSQNDIVYVLYPSYLTALNRTLPHFSDRTVHNGLLLLYATDTLYELINTTLHRDWPHFCTQITMNLFKEVVSALFVRQYRRQQLDTLRMRMSHLFDSLKKTLEEKIKVAPWLDDTSRAHVLVKLAHLHGQFLSWPNFWNSSYVEELLEDVHVDAENFFGNVVRRYVQLSRVAVGIKNRPLEIRQQHPFIANAFYVAASNTMIIPLAVLVQPQFHSDVPRYIHYATLGHIFAHEILHAFDLIGSEFDYQGEPNKILTKETLKKLSAKINCVQHQFAKNFFKTIPFLGKNVEIQFDWNASLNENMADISGIEVAYQAWKSSIGNSQEQFLPELSFSPSQIFFLTSAQMYCSDLTPEMYILLVERNTHAPYPERVNGMLMNSLAFAEAFKCPPGSRMNPTKKCSMW